MPNSIKIFASVAKILRFFNFSRLHLPPSWIFKLVKFYWQMVSGGPRCIILQNIVKISLSVAEISHFFQNFKDGRRHL